MESEAQKVEAIKKTAKYRRHVMKKRKHERNMAQARENEDRKSNYRKRTEFDAHRAYPPAANLKNVTAGRLSVPRGLFLKGKASSVLKKTGDAYLNPLNYARKTEKLGQIIKIGMDQAQKIDNQINPKRNCNKDPVTRLPEETEVMNVETESTQEAKRKKNVDRIKTVLGLADPAPSFMPSPTADAQDTKFSECGVPAPERPLVKRMPQERKDSPRRSPRDINSPHDVRTPDRVPSQQSFNMPEVEEKVDEMDDLYLEKLVSDIGLYAWNSQKPGSEPYENCDEKLINEIISLRDVSLNEMAKCIKANKAEQPTKVSETITSLPPGLPQSIPNLNDFKLGVCDDDKQFHWASHRQKGFTRGKVREQTVTTQSPQSTTNLTDFKPTVCDDKKQVHWVSHRQTGFTRGEVRQHTVTTQSHSVEYNPPDGCFRDLLMWKGAERRTEGSESTDDEPAGMMPLTENTSFVSPSTPPIAVAAFDPKAFMQDVEVKRRPQEELRYPPRAGCSTGGGCGSNRHFDRAVSSRHFDRSEDEFNADDYDTALSQCYDAEVSERSDDSDVSCNLYKYRRAMY